MPDDIQQILDLSVEEILEDPDNTRPVAPDDELRQLGESMLAVGQQQPVSVYRDGEKYRLIAGHRRLGAAKLVGIPTLKSVLMTKPVGGRLVLGRMAENKARKNLTPGQDVGVVVRAKRENPGMSNKEIAAHTGYSESTISVCLSVDACPIAREAVAGGLSLNDSYTVAQSPAGMKEEVFARLKAGEGSHAVAAAVRAARKPRAAEAVKVSSIRTLLPSGVSIVAKGEGLSLEDLAESLAEARKEVLKAVSDGLNAKTYSAVVAQKSRKAGGA